MKSVIRLIFCLLWFGVHAIKAADRYVVEPGTPGGTNTGAFTNWTIAATQIQWAVSLCTNGDTVWISNGTYVLTNQITVWSNIAIRGTGGRPVVDGNNATRCFVFSSTANGMLSNLFITRGYSSGNGGGVCLSNGAVWNCIFSNNISGNGSGGLNLGGGGMYVFQGTNPVRNCTFVGNTAASSGGGLYLYKTASVVANCLFITNTASGATYGGGGLFAESPSGTLITGCDFAGNVATNNGGGAYFYATTTTNTVTYSTFSNNVALGVSGGGMYILGAWIVSNCVASDNVAANTGGGVYVKGGSLLNCLAARNTTLITSGGFGGGGIDMQTAAFVQNCTINENTSGAYGGGVYLAAGILRNSLIKNNVAGTGGGGLRRAGVCVMSGCTIVSNYSTTSAGGIFDNTSSTGNIDNCVIYFNEGSGGYSNCYNALSPTSYTNCCLAPALTGLAATYSTNNTTSDPLFVDRTAGDWHLKRNSPCVNAGVNRDWMTNANDLDGRRRIDISSGIVDMGCYEYIPAGARFIIK